MTNTDAFFLSTLGRCIIGIPCAILCIYFIFDLVLHKNVISKAIKYYVFGQRKVDVKNLETYSLNH
jgi:hypothetical protein